MAQFDLYTIINQSVITLVGFLFFYFIVKKYFLVQLKRQEFFFYYITKSKPTYNWLKTNSFTINNMKKYNKVLPSFFKNCQ